MLESGLPHTLWPELMLTAIRILNMTPKQRLHGKTPHEMAYKEKPHLGHLRIRGSKAYVNIPPEKRQKGDKMSPRALISWLVGQESSGIFRIWIPASNDVVRSKRDVLIDEAVKYGHEPNPTMDELLSTTDAVPLNIDEILAENITTSEGTSSGTAASTTIDRIARFGETMTPATFTDILRDDNITTATTGDTTTNLDSLEERNTGLLTPEPSTRGKSTTPDRPGPQRSPEPEEPETPIEDVNPLPNPDCQTAESSRRQYDTSQGIDPANIVSGTRRNRGERRRDVFFSLLESKDWEHTCFFTQADGSPLPTTETIGNTPSAIGCHISEAPPEPKHRNEALRHPYKEYWLLAEETEIASLGRNGTFEEVERPSDGTKPTPVKWVYKYKTDMDGFIVRYKARLVVRGDMVQGDDSDLYACTLAYRTLRILLAIIAYFGLVTLQIDVVNAFLNSLMKPGKTTYVACPKGYERGYCWKLKKALYGLPESPRLWYDDIRQKLEGLDYEAIAEDQCLFIHKRLFILVFIYVDDMVIAAREQDQHEIEALYEKLLEKYRLRRIGTLSNFLNLQIYHDREAKQLWFSQTNYIEESCRQFNLFGENTWTPMPVRPILDTATEKPTDSLHNTYRRMVGKLIYPMAISRPDIAWAVGALARHMHKPALHHLEAAKRIFRYLYTTRYLAITYSARPANEGANEQSTDALRDWMKQDFLAASDAAYADDVETRRSSQGILIKLFNGPVYWKSTRQKTVATSTTEAELIALSSVAKEALVLMRLFKRINFKLDHDVTLACDNKQTVRAVTADKVEFTTKLKHIDVHHFWLRQELDNGALRLAWIPTAEMPADGLTKPLTKDKHRRFIRELGLVDASDLILGRRSI